MKSRQLTHLLLAPVYLYQAKRLKKQTVRLAEPSGARAGSVSLTEDSVSNHAHTCHKPCYRILVMGDSSAAGVGVARQEQALMGQLLTQLAKQDSINSLSNSYDAIDWKLEAQTGLDSFDVLHRLYTMPALSPAAHLDVLIVVVGVNDVKNMQAAAVWQNNLAEIVAIARHKLAPTQIIFSAVPPMASFPALPYPLNQLIGAKAAELDGILQDFCSNDADIHYADFDFLPSHASSNSSNKADNQLYFAEDGFHPSELTYRLWARALAGRIVDL